MSDLTNLTIAEARDGLTKKAFKATELVDAHIKAVEKARALNAFVTETPDLARAAAAESDKRIAAGSARPLDGIPLGIKDLFCTKDVLTTAGSHILDGFKPAYESTVSRNLFNDGAVMLGKLNMDEFAMGSSNETSYYGPVINPWRRKWRRKPRPPPHRRLLPRQLHPSSPALTLSASSPRATRSSPDGARQNRVLF